MLTVVLELIGLASAVVVVKVATNSCGPTVVGRYMWSASPPRISLATPAPSVVTDPSGTSRAGVPNWVVVKENATGASACGWPLAPVRVAVSCTLPPPSTPLMVIVGAPVAVLMEVLSGDAACAGSAVPTPNMPRRATSSRTPSVPATRWDVPAAPAGFAARPADRLGSAGG